MVRYRRNLIAGGTFFLTATLADRTSSALTNHVADLRMAVRLTRRQHPFTVDAVVVLPDHIHMIMTLPPDDADFPIRLSLIKRRFTTAIAKAGATVARRQNGELALWQRRFWERTIRDETDFERHVDYIHFNPGKTQPCDPSAGLAVLVFSSLRATWNLAGRLGRRFWPISRKLRRAERLAPDFAAAQSGLLAASSLPALTSAPEAILPAALNRPTAKRDQWISRSAFADLMAGGCHV
jgi:putative transposase